jgi:hypothetical protein
MFDQLVADTATTHGAPAVDAWTRVENGACARRLDAMVDMLDDAYAADGSTDRDQWCLDNFDAVAIHVGAAQRLTRGTAAHLLLIGLALKQRFPKVHAVFADGLIGYALAKTIVTRAANVTDPTALHDLDAALAEALREWVPMSKDRTEQTLDAFIVQFDPYAVRRTQTDARGRHVDVVVDEGTGMAQVYATLFPHDAQTLDARITAMTATVCPNDPRTRDQLRADATGPVSLGADRMPCLCDREDCPAATLAPASAVVVHVVAHQDTLTDTPAPPAPDGPDAPGPDESPEPDGVSDDSSDDLTTVDEDHTNPDDARDESGDAESSDSPTLDAPIKHDTPEPEHAVEESSDPADEGVDGEPGPDPEPTLIDPAEECAGLDGDNPPLVFSKPLHEMTLTQIATELSAADCPAFSRLRPATLLGGPVLPGSIARRAASGSRLEVIVHPGQAPPEPRYTPSRKLADFVRCRDLTCRFPGCREPATNCDLDHVIPWPYGTTCASNLACLCRKHHLLKTFWVDDVGWRVTQCTDGTQHWTAPDGRIHTTTPGSRLLFPSLSAPTAPVITTGTPPARSNGLATPRRRSTRAEDRARRIAHERELNRAEIDNLPPEPPPPF